MAKTEIDSKAAEAANEEQVKETESFFGRRTSAGGRKREKRIFLQEEG